LSYRRAVLTFIIVIIVITLVNYLESAIHYNILGQERAEPTNTTNYNTTISTITIISTVYSTITTTIGIYHTITYTTILTLNRGVMPEIVIVIVMICIIIALIIGYIIGLKIRKEEHEKPREEVTKKVIAKRR